MSGTPIDRAARWTPLLRALTDEVAVLTAWKPYEAALTEAEDVDVAAPRSTWPQVERIFRAWAEEHGAPVVVCSHVPRVLNLIAVHGRDLLQLEVRDSHTFRGALQWRAEDLLPAAQVDARGVRVLRPGAQGLLWLPLRATRRGGRVDPGQLEEQRVGELLAADPAGAAAMAGVLRHPRRALVRAAEAVVAGGWDRRAMLRVEAGAAFRALLTPRVAIEQTWFRRVGRPRCPVLGTAYREGRRIEGSTAEWFRDAARSGHRVAGVDGLRTAGRFVVIVGPDGVGKTTVARELLARHAGETGYVYFRPPLRGRLPAGPPEGVKPRGDKNPPAQLAVKGWLRLLKNLIQFWAGYVSVVRPVLRRGGLVVGDRWAYGYVVQPGPLGFFGPDWLARLGVRAMPHPDLVVNLTAPPAVVVARKDELTAEQVDRELAIWASLPVPRIATIDAVGDVAAVTDAVARALEDPGGAGRSR